MLYGEHILWNKYLKWKITFLSHDIRNDYRKYGNIYEPFTQFKTI